MALDFFARIRGRAALIKDMTAHPHRHAAGAPASQGGQFRTSSAPESASGLDIEHARPTQVSTLKRGDTVFAGGRRRVVAAVSTDGTRTLVILHDGSSLSSDDAADIVSVDTAPEPWTYECHGDYYGNLAVAYAADTSSDTLGDILASETEDDFMVAIVRHHNATSEQIEIASRHHAFLVRSEALRNPKVFYETVERIRDEAEAGASEALAALEGTSPMRDYYRATLEAQAALHRDASLLLEAADAAERAAR